jgi:hypothetical protein
MKIAIGFFGITRSLKYTIKSIKQNIFNVFKENNIEYDIFMHTYFLKSYENERAKEKKTDKIDNEEYKLLSPKYLKIDDQDDIIKKIILTSYRKFLDPWKTTTSYQSVDFFILGSYSKYMLTNMIENVEDNYDYILFVRPDCLYRNKLDLKYLDLVNYNTIVIPDFHLYGLDAAGKGMKINDRFAITNKETYKIYGQIFLQLLDLSKKMSLHSESILGLILRNNNIIVKRVNFRFARVRCNGRIDSGDPCN